jgi:opacity protein-like surface antigen
MQYRRSIVALAGILAAGISTAQAQDAPGWYVGTTLGPDWFDGSHDSNGNLYLHSATDPGYNILGAVGRSLGNGLRLEGEIGYRQADLGRVSVTRDGGLGAAAGTGSLNGVANSNTNGDANALSFMANGFYDITLPNTGLVPYFGGGLGFARVAAEGYQLNNVPLVNDSAVVFAYQAGAGVSYPLSMSTTAFIDYRYFATEDPTFRDAVGDRFKSEVASHSLSLGLRYKF